MLFTLEQARRELARFVGSGSCDAAAIDARINEAVARLADSVQADRMRRLMRVTVVGGKIPLPASVETVLWANTDTVPARVFGRPYEFLSSGLGDLDSRCSGSGFKDLVDRGDGWPVMYDVPAHDDGLHLHVYSDDAGDLGSEEVPEDPGPPLVPAVPAVPADTVSVAYVDTDSKTQRVQLSLEEWPVAGVPALSGTLDELVDADPSGVTAVSVERVVKEATGGHVYLVAVDHATGDYTLLARYEPGDTVPQFRRYELTNVRSTETETCILMLVRLRVLPLVHDDDVVPIDSMQALKLMMMAIRDENAGKIDTASAFEGKAIYLMNNRASANHLSGGAPVVINVDYRTSLGRALNRGVL
jgi:hypothetical protein